jgi:hypothetical protein
VVAIGGRRLKAEEMPWKQRDHAWFVAFAPAEAPKVALAVLVEHADGGGGKIAAPIAATVLKEFFRLEESRGPVKYARIDRRLVANVEWPLLLLTFCSSAAA